MRLIRILKQSYSLLAIAFGKDFTNYYGLFGFILKTILGRIDVFTQQSNTGAILVIAIVERYQNCNNKIHIAYLLVDENYRRIGFGQKMLIHIENHYCALGIYVITVYTYINRPMQNLLQSIGYEIEGKETAKLIYQDRITIRNFNSVHDEEYEETHLEPEPITVYFKVL